jgi:hypothetical protein
MPQNRRTGPASASRCSALAGPGFGEAIVFFAQVGGPFNTQPGFGDGLQRLQAGAIPDQVARTPVATLSSTLKARPEDGTGLRAVLAVGCLVRLVARVDREVGGVGGSGELRVEAVMRMRL